MSTPSGRVKGEVVAEFKCKKVWLLELVRVDQTAEQLVSAVPQARYADKLLEKITDEAWKAHWFDTKAEAESFLDKAPAAPEGLEWRAMDHGFCEG